LKIEHFIVSRVPPAMIFRWWTDLKEGETIEGGKSLRSMRVLKREGEEITVESEWKFMGRSVLMRETMTRFPPLRWSVKPESGSLPFDVVDEFDLEEHGQGARLRIRSDIKGKNVFGKILLPFMSRAIRRGFTEEWDCAIRSLESESEALSNSSGRNSESSLGLSAQSV